MKNYLIQTIFLWITFYMDLLRGEGVARFLEVIPLTKLDNETIEEPHGPELIRNVINAVVTSTTSSIGTGTTAAIYSSSTHSSLPTNISETTPTEKSSTITTQASTTTSNNILIQSTIEPIKNLSSNTTSRPTMTNSSLIPVKETVIDSSIENLSYNFINKFLTQNFKSDTQIRKKRCFDGGCGNEYYYDPSSYGCSKRRFRTFEAPRLRYGRCCSSSKCADSDPEVVVPKSVSCTPKCKKSCECTQSSPKRPIYRPIFQSMLPDYGGYYGLPYPDYDFRDYNGYYRDYKEFDRRRRSLSILGRQLMARLKSQPIDLSSSENDY